MDLEKLKTAKLGHLLSGDNMVFELKGMRDGQAGQPTDRLTMMEGLIADAASALSGYKVAIENELIKYRGRRDAAHKEQEEALTSESQLQGQKTNALDNLNKMRGGRLTAAELHLKEVQQEYNIIVAQVGGRPLRSGNHIIYFILMCIVALVEWPVNRVAFEAAFQEAPSVAAIIALAVGIAISIIAHFVGVIACRNFGSGKDKKIAPIVALGFLVAFTIFVIYIIALARHEFIKLISVQNVKAADLFQNKIVSAVTEGFFTPSFTPSDWGLVIVNMLVFIVAVLIAYSAHDAHPDYARTHRKRNKILKAIAKEKETFDHEFNKISNENDQRISAVHYRATALTKEIQSTEADIRQLERAVEDAYNEVVNAVTRRVNVYIQANRSARSSGVIPDCISKPPEQIEIAHDLRSRMATS